MNMASPLDAVSNFFGPSEAAFMEEADEGEDLDVVSPVQHEPVEPVIAAPVVAPGVSTDALSAKIDGIVARMDEKERVSEANINKMLADMLGDEEVVEEELDLASVAKRAADAESLVLELATRQTATELAAAVSKYGVDRDVLLQAVIDSEGGDPDVLARALLAKTEAEEARVLERLQAKHPGIKDVLATGQSRSARAGQDAPTLRGTPTGVPNKTGADLKRQTGESSSEHLARLMDAGAFQGF
jgi:hypothetical protein